jgi:hypothetical protein
MDGQWEVRSNPEDELSSKPFETASGFLYNAGFNNNLILRKTNHVVTVLVVNRQFTKSKTCPPQNLNIYLNRLKTFKCLAAIVTMVQ